MKPGAMEADPPENCHLNVTFLEFFCHSNGNFPEGQDGRMVEEWRDVLNESVI